MIREQNYKHTKESSYKVMNGLQKGAMLKKDLSEKFLISSVLHCDMHVNTIEEDLIIQQSDKLEP